MHQRLFSYLSALNLYAWILFSLLIIDAWQMSIIL